MGVAKFSRKRVLMDFLKSRLVLILGTVHYDELQTQETQRQHNQNAGSMAWKHVTTVINHRNSAEISEALLWLTTSS